jgi:2'-5' RNA ligase
MTVLVLQPPPREALQLRRLKVPGDRTIPGTQHITVFHFGKDVPKGMLDKILKSTYEVAEQVQPFSVSLRQISSLPRHPDKGTIPVVCPVEGSELQDLWKRLKKVYDRDKVEYSGKFPTYKPHTTLSYLGEDEEAPPDRPLPEPLSWDVSQLVLWGGDKENAILETTFPLGKKMATIQKVATRSLWRRFPSGALPWELE